jgi:hypothetical protein
VKAKGDDVEIDILTLTACGEKIYSEDEYLACRTLNTIGQLKPYTPSFWQTKQYCRKLCPLWEQDGDCEVGGGAKRDEMKGLGASRKREPLDSGGAFMNR